MAGGSSNRLAVNKKEKKEQEGQNVQEEGQSRMLLRHLPVPCHKQF